MYTILFVIIHYTLLFSMEDGSFPRSIRSVVESEWWQDYLSKLSSDECFSVTLTYAQSLDGSIAAESGTMLSLSSPPSFAFTHALRSVHDCILIGVGTLKNDNPSLTTRLVSGKNPKPVIIDSKLTCPVDCKLFTRPDCLKPIIFAVASSCAAIEERRARLEDLGAKVVMISSKKTERVPLDEAFKSLREMGYRSAMVEGGGGIITSLASLSPSSHLLTSVILTIAPVYVGGFNAIRTSVASTNETLRRMRLKATFQLENDIIACYEP